MQHTLDPLHYAAAMKTTATGHCTTAIEYDLKNLRDNQTWVVVQRPPDVKPLASCLVLKFKLDADVAIDRYKARLVARGGKVEGVTIKTSSRW
jgi:hypothetical protein